MTKNHYYIIKQSSIQFVVNFAIAGAIALFMSRQLSLVSLWPKLDNIEELNMSVDLLMGGFFLALALTLILTPLTRLSRRKGAVSFKPVKGIIARLPISLFKRAMVIATGLWIVFGLISVALLFIAGLESMSPTSFALLKSILSGTEAALVTVIVVKRALAEPEPIKT
jgi:hypothetical protein